MNAESTIPKVKARVLTPFIALNKMCQSVQNAARLAYHATKAPQDQATLVARNRFLPDEFPPRGGTSTGDKPAPPPAP
jgi:hypothetical protein